MAIAHHTPLNTQSSMHRQPSNTLWLHPIHIYMPVSTTTPSGAAGSHLVEGYAAVQPANRLLTCGQEQHWGTFCPCKWTRTPTLQGKLLTAASCLLMLPGMQGTNRLYTKKGLEKCCLHPTNMRAWGLKQAVHQQALCAATPYRCSSCQVLTNQTGMCVFNTMS